MTDGPYTQGPIYRMPYGFGPMPGPRQTAQGGRHDWTHGPRSRSAELSFATDADRLQALLPPGFALDGEPRVVLRLTELSDLAWLAGRGYAMLGVHIPAAFHGRRDRARGLFLAVLWENLADPIISGREELGYAKLPADIVPARWDDDGPLRAEASWCGHVFFTLEIDGLSADPVPPVTDPGDGLLHYKYIPRSGAWGEADCAYACLTPPAPSARKTLAVKGGAARFGFHRADWRAMPTQFHVVSALADLPVRDVSAVRVETSVGATDLRQQRPLA